MYNPSSCIARTPTIGCTKKPPPLAATRLPYPGSSEVVSKRGAAAVTPALAPHWPCCALAVAASSETRTATATQHGRMNLTFRTGVFDSDASRNEPQAPRLEDSGI